VIFAQLAGIGFYLVVIFQLALVIGLPWGEYTQGGKTKGRLSTSGRITAAVSAVILVGMAQALLAPRGVGLFATAPEWLIGSMVWVTFGYAVLGFIVNWITPSKKERLIWGPVTTVLLVLVSLAVFTN
jgi:hypothetical protein